MKKILHVSNILMLVAIVLAFLLILSVGRANAQESEACILELIYAGQSQEVNICEGDEPVIVEIGQRRIQIVPVSDEYDPETHAEMFFVGATVTQASDLTIPLRCRTDHTLDSEIIEYISKSVKQTFTVEEGVVSQDGYNWIKIQELDCWVVIGAADPEENQPYEPWLVVILG